MRWKVGNTADAGRYPYFLLAIDPPGEDRPVYSHYSNNRKLSFRALILGRRDPRSAPLRIIVNWTEEQERTVTLNILIGQKGLLFSRLSGIGKIYI